MSQLETPSVFAYKPEGGISQVAAPPFSYRLAIIAMLVALVFVKNLGAGCLIDLEIRLMFVQPAPDPFAGVNKDDFYKMGWPLSFISTGEDTSALASAALKISLWKAILFTCFNLLVGAWLVYAAYGYLCECYLMLGWRLNATILFSVAVILFSLFVEIQDVFEYYNGAGAVCGAIVRLSDIMMPFLLFCGFLQLLEKLSQGWRWLLARRS